MFFTLTDALGLAAAPLETFAALKPALERANAHTTAILITDCQGHRLEARYALLLKFENELVLSREAFGPRYGLVGLQALREMTELLLERGVTEWRECVIMTYDFSRLMNDPEDYGANNILASSNYSDANIYLARF